MMKDKLKIFNQRGFTLVELAIVSLIAGILIVGFGAALKVQLARIEAKQQKEIMNNTLAALTRFVHTNGRYPCPADPTLAPSDPNYGISICAPGGGIVERVGTSGQRILVGSFPFASLNAQDENGDGARVNGLDYYSNKLTYAVTQNLATNSPIDLINDPGGITIIDYNNEEGILSNATTTTTTAHFVLVSHGRNGAGAFTRNGQLSRKVCSNQMEIANCNKQPPPANEQAQYRTASLVRSTNNISIMYDDTVFYHLPECNPNLGDSIGDACLFSNSTGATGDGTIETTMNMKSMGSFGVGVDVPAATVDVDGETKISWENNRTCTGNIEGSLRYNFAGDVNDRFVEYCAFVPANQDGVVGNDDDDSFAWTRIDERRPCEGIRENTNFVCAFANTNIIDSNVDNSALDDLNNRVFDGCTDLGDNIQIEAAAAGVGLTETMAEFQTGGFNKFYDNSYTPPRERNYNIILQFPNVIFDIYRGGYLVPIPIPLSGIANYKLYQGSDLYFIPGGGEARGSLPGREGVVGLGAPGSIVGNLINVIAGGKFTDVSIGLAFYQPERFLPPMDHMEIAVIKDTFCSVGLGSYDKSGLFDEPLMEEKTIYQCIDGRIREVARWHSLIYGDCPVEVPF